MHEIYSEARIGKRKVRNQEMFKRGNNERKNYNFLQFQFLSPAPSWEGAGGYRGGGREGRSGFPPKVFSILRFFFWGGGRTLLVWSVNKVFCAFLNCVIVGYRWQAVISPINTTTNIHFLPANQHKEILLFCSFGQNIIQTWISDKGIIKQIMSDRFLNIIKLKCPNMSLDFCFHMKLANNNINTLLYCYLKRHFRELKVKVQC